MRRPGSTKVDTLFDPNARLAATPFGCGQCMACRINKSRVWQHRLMLEQMTHEKSNFTTLTYSDENLPEKNQVSKDELKKFLKRLRKIANQKVRYFGVGEYGDKSDRPHYHLAIYGMDTGYKKIIDQAWQEKGWTYIGDLTPESARYMTGYVTKKLTRIDDPRLNGRNPEFMSCSKMQGGLGLDAIKIIAKKLKSQPYWKPKIIKELQHGKRNLPLGRYLTDKLNEELGITDEMIEANLNEYQNEVFNKYMENSKFYYDNILDKNKVKRLQMHKRAEIHKQRKTI